MPHDLSSSCSHPCCGPAIVSPFQPSGPLHPPNSDVCLLSLQNSVLGNLRSLLQILRQDMTPGGAAGARRRQRGRSMRRLVRRLRRWGLLPRTNPPARTSETRSQVPPSDAPLEALDSSTGPAREVGAVGGQEGGTVWAPQAGRAAGWRGRAGPRLLAAPAPAMLLASGQASWATTSARGAAHALGQPSPRPLLPLLLSIRA